MSARALPQTRRWHRAILVVAAVLPYLNALPAGFVFDDGPVIRDNPAVTGPFDPWAAIGAPVYPRNLYRPVAVLSYALNELLAPGSATLFHAVNVVLHALVTLMVYRLGEILCESPAVALVGGLVFAVHPIHTEAVTGIVGRAELLAALFGLGALLATLTSQIRQRPGWDGLALLSFTAALFSKESAATVLGLIPLCRATLRGGSLLSGLIRELRSCHWCWFVLPVMLFLAARTYLVGSVALPEPAPPLDNVLAHTPALVRIQSALAILTDYTGLLLAPLVLSADYSWRQVVPVSTWLSARVLCGVGLLAGSAGAFFWYSRRRPALSVLAVFPWITLSLTANILMPIGTVKAERLLYLPSVGFALLVAAIGSRAQPWWQRPLFGALLATVLLAFCVRTWVRNGDWFDNLTLYRTMVEVVPQSAKAHHNYGTALEHQGDREEADLHYRQALRLYEDYDESAFAIGLIYEKKGLANGAIEWYRRALKIAPRHRSANTNLCGILFKVGQYEEAQIACRHGLLSAPADVNLLKVLGASMVEGRDFERGLPILQRALVLDPSDVQLRDMIERARREGDSPRSQP
jgi:Tfp pilus assembly protein PilF